MTDLGAARGRTRWLAVLLVVVLSLSACGGDPAPSESAPGLGTRLERVDEAIAAGDLDEARSALSGLAAAAAQAQVDGRITSDQADEIREAVSATLRALDTVAPELSPTEAPTPEDEADQRSEDADEGEPAGGGGDESGGKGKDKGKDKGKGKGD